MARISTITFAQVAQIADTMKAAGTRPTARAVRERIGSGSMGTIHKLLQQWAGKTAVDDENSEGPELPSSIASTLMDFVATQVAEACEPLNEKLTEAKAAADALAEENERLCNQIEMLKKESYEAEMRHAGSMASERITASNLAEAKEELTRLRNAAKEMERDLDRSQRQTEMMASYAPELAAARNALAESEAKRIEAEKNAAVLAAQLEAKTAVEIDLTTRLKTAENHASTAEQEARTANTHYQACATRLESTAREIESLKAKPKTTPIKTVTKTAVTKN